MSTYVPIIAAILTALLSAPLTLYFTRESRQVSLVTAQAQTIETYWRRIQDKEQRERGLLAKIEEYEERILRLEARVGRLLSRIEELERRQT